MAATKRWNTQTTHRIEEVDYGPSMHLRWWSSPSSGMRPPQILYNWQGQWVDKGAFLLHRSIEREREREIRTFVHVTHIWYMICYLYYIQKGSVVCAFYCSKLHKASYAPPGRMELCTGKAVRQVQKTQKHSLTLRKRNELYYESTYTIYGIYRIYTVQTCKLYAHL